MSENKDKGEEGVGDCRTCEQMCLEQLDRECNLDERLKEEKRFASENLWYQFQNSASAVTALYKGIHNSTLHLLNFHSWKEGFKPILTYAMTNLGLSLVTYQCLRVRL